METLRRAVAPRECDILGHMNVAAYVDAMSDAMFSLQSAMGLGRADMEAHRLSFVAAHFEADYRAELRAGDVIVMTTRPVHIGTKSARFAHCMTRGGDTALVWEATLTSVLFHLDTRRAMAIPDDLRQALTGLMEADT